MNKFSLTAKEKAVLEHCHRKTCDVCELDRIKTVLLHSEGWSIAAIAQALREHESTTSRHIKDYLEEAKLTVIKGGSDSFLPNEQTEALTAHLTEALYHHTHDIVVYIRERWSIEYSVSDLNKLLHRQGFTKPKGRPYKVNLAKQVAFMKKLKASLNNSEKILFINAVHPSQATKLSYRRIKKGQTVDLSTTVSRTRVNLIGAIELENISKTVTDTDEIINTEAASAFFQKLREQYPIKLKLHLVLEQSGYHRSGNLKKAAKNLNIHLHYLPPCSPNLNPIERLWKVMNEHVRDNKFFNSAKAFRSSILNFFEKTLSEIGDSLSERINDNYQKLNHAH